ncbi:hypothetical protein Vretifemale_15330, partial [Volvox reticuliferus]
MSFFGMIFGVILLAIVLTASFVYVRRDRLLDLAAHCVGVSEYGAEKLTWRSCRRLRLLLRKGPVRCVRLEYANLHMPAGGESITHALWLILRLVLAVAVGKHWAKPGYRPLLVLRVQGLELEIRNKKPRTDSSGAEVAAMERRSTSEGGNSGQGPTPRNSGGGSGDADDSDFRMGDSNATRRGLSRLRRGRGGSSGTLFLPEALLRLLPLVRLELKDGHVRAEFASDKPDGNAGKDAGAVAGTEDAASKSPMWEARLSAVVVAASNRRNIDDGNGADDLGNSGHGDGVGSTSGPYKQARMPRDGHGHAGNSSQERQFQTGLSGSVKRPVAVANAAEGVLTGAGPAENGPAGKATVSMAQLQQPQTQKSGQVTSLTVSLTGMEVIFRRPQALTAAAWTATCAAAASVTAAPMASQVPASKALASEALLITGRCGGLSAIATFGRCNRAGCNPAALGAVAVDVKEVHLDCRAAAAIAGSHTSAGTSNGGERPDATAMAAAAVAEAAVASPMVATLVALLTAAASINGCSPSSKRTWSGSKAVSELMQPKLQQQQDRKPG